jgi:hypothetical protein
MLFQWQNSYLPHSQQCTGHREVQHHELVNKCKNLPVQCAWNLIRYIINWLLQIQNTTEIFIKNMYTIFILFILYYIYIQGIPYKAQPKEQMCLNNVKSVIRC